MLVARAATAGVPLAQVAARAGYYDQSHLVRDFHEFAGLSPSAWLAAERGSQEFPNLQVGRRDDQAASWA